MRYFISYLFSASLYHLFYYSDLTTVYQGCLDMLRVVHNDRYGAASVSQLQSVCECVCVTVCDFRYLAASSS